MLDLIKSEFGETPDDFNKSGQELVLEALKDYYLKLVDHAKKQFYIGAKSVAETFEIAYKINKDNTLNRLEVAFGLREGHEKNFGFHAKRWANVVSFFFVGSVVSFIICVATICFYFFLL